MAKYAMDRLYQKFKTTESLENDGALFRITEWNASVDLKTCKREYFIHIVEE